MAEEAERAHVACSVHSLSRTRVRRWPVVTLSRLIRETEGQDIIEYSLLALFISIAAYLTVESIGQDVSSLYTTITPATSAGAS